MIQDRYPNPDQMNFLHADLLDQLNPKHPLLRLAKNIPWDYFETGFSPLYSDQGRPAKPIRLMVGLSILKHLENLSDEVLIDRWCAIRISKCFAVRRYFSGSFLATLPI